jgi:hypothetical protein
MRLSATCLRTDGRTGTEQEQEQEPGSRRSRSPSLSSSQLHGHEFCPRIAGVQKLCGGCQGLEGGGCALLRARDLPGVRIFELLSRETIFQRNDRSRGQQ